MGRRRFGRGLIAATFVSTLLIPSIGSRADPEDRLDRTRDALEQVRGELEADRTRADDLRERIRVLERDMTKLHIAVVELDRRIARVQSVVHDTEMQIAETQRRMDAIEGRATEQAVALYKSDGVDVLGALLESTSLAELDARVRMLGIAARKNIDALVKFGRLKVEIEAQAHQLFVKREELTKERQAQADLLELRRQRKAELDEAYASLSSDIVKLKHREGDLEEAASDLRARIIASQARRAVESLGTSAQGFIWPLNGPLTSYFGPRWGRMHTGVDIDGYTGQPIVAAKGGRVIMASPYSGYGNAVIIDHGGGVATLYAHMSSFAVSSGQNVTQGQIVGSVGCTGSCTGDHLHFEVRVNGSPVDPMDYLP